ncbi:MAG TPA: VWA domain-containing protein [Pyrinomonadaceae bacterium]|nr:VWA domain-containing protein [Pyrinomonadaceae bacterium]
MPHPQRHALPSSIRIAALMLLCLLPISAQQPQQPSSSGNSGAVNLFFTVTDKTGRAVTTLRREDIRVLEDGRPQEIADFILQTDKPLSIVVMLDMSVSQENVIPIAKQVSQEFVDTSVRRGRDNVGVITFTGKAKLEQELTGNLDKVRRSIERINFEPPAGYVKGVGKIVMGPPPKRDPAQSLPGSTAVWDAVGFASEKVALQSSADARRVIILFTDGNDTSSSHNFNDAVRLAVKEDVAVYSIGIADQYFGGTSESELRKLSERTGGRAYFPKKVKDLHAVFEEIGQELRSQYLVSYSSTGVKAPDKMRKIKIELVNPELRKQGLQLSYQQGYFTR